MKKSKVLLAEILKGDVMIRIKNHNEYLKVKDMLSEVIQGSVYDHMIGFELIKDNYPDCIRMCTMINAVDAEIYRLINNGYQSHVTFDQFVYLIKSTESHRESNLIFQGLKSPFIVERRLMLSILSGK